MIAESRAWGAVGTPPEVVRQMVGWAGLEAAARWEILEPACGDAPFLSAIALTYPSAQHHYWGVEINPQQAAATSRAHPTFHIVSHDFLLWETNQRFDLIIGNPPYGIVGDATHYPIHTLKEQKAKYRERFVTWRGKYNIYGAFIEQAVRLLRPKGRLVFIVPGTWLLLDDFQDLRRFLAREGRVIVRYMGTVFPRRLVVAVVLILERGGHGLELWDHDQLILARNDYDGGLIRFETEATRAFEEGKIPLGEVFSFHFAARSPEFRRHPAVRTRPEPGLVPALTGRNLRPGWIDYATATSGFWLPLEKAPALRSFYGFPHIVVGHTKGGKVVAARDERCYPWREEIHLVPRHPESKVNEAGLVAYLNSPELNQYMRALYRDLSPHITITQLRLLPIPPELVESRVYCLPLFEP